MNSTRGARRPAKLLATIVIFSLILGIGLFYLGLGEPTASTAGDDDDGVDSLQAIASLHRLYPVFTDPEKRAGMDLQQRRQVEAEFKTLLKLVPLDLLVPQMEKYSVASAQQVRAFDDPEGFVQRLAAVAMNGIITPPVVETPAFGDIEFRPDLAIPGNHEVFGTRERVVAAVFDSSGYPDTRVLVKWYQTDNGRIALFKQFDILPGDSNYIWIHNDNGFEPGSYQVEIYRVNQALELLSSGSYRVAD